LEKTILPNCPFFFQKRTVVFLFFKKLGLVGIDKNFDSIFNATFRVRFFDSEIMNVKKYVPLVVYKAAIRDFFIQLVFFCNPEFSDCFIKQQ
jgi:hypothetical protein